MRKILILLFVCMLCFVPPVWAAKQSMFYDVYASGIHVLEARLDVDTKTARYDIVLNSHTRGFLGAMVPWRGTFESHGWALSKTDFRPELHQSHTFTDEDEEKKQYRYTQTGFKDLTVTENGKAKKSKKAKEQNDPALTKGTTDALTATLKVLAGVAAEKPCEGESDIFDGRRRFTQKFNPQEDQTLKPSDYNVFSGPAEVCTVEVIPKGGAWHKKPRGWMSIQEQGRKAGALPTMWVSTVKPGGPAVPVKIMIKTGYGTLFLHLAEYRDGDKVLIAEKRKK